MEKKILEKLILDGKSQRQISEELGCGQTNVRYWLSKYNLCTTKKPYNRNFDETIDESTKTCGKCGLEKDLSEYHMRSGENPVSYCKKCHTMYTIQKRKDIKVKAVKYKGGKCQVCGYDKYYGSLHFHHLDPTKKDFNISHKGHSRKWSDVKQELDKCVVVCANCHSEIHAGITQL